MLLKYTIAFTVVNMRCCLFSLVSGLQTLIHCERNRCNMSWIKPNSLQFSLEHTHKYQHTYQTILLMTHTTMLYFYQIFLFVQSEEIFQCKKKNLTQLKFMINDVYVCQWRISILVISFCKIRIHFGSSSLLFLIFFCMWWKRTGSRHTISPSNLIHPLCFAHKNKSQIRFTLWRILRTLHHITTESTVVWINCIFFV